MAKDPGNINDIWNDFYYHTFWGKGGGAIFYAAASALEQALWDIKGKKLGIPVYEFFGGKQRDVLRVYANDWGDKGFVHPKEMAQRASEVVADGFTCLKMIPSEQIRSHSQPDPPHQEPRGHDGGRQDDAYGRRYVRDAIGPDIDLMVDVTAEGSVGTMTRIGAQSGGIRPDVV